MSRLKDYLTERTEEWEMSSKEYKELKDIMVECSDMYELYKREKQFFYRGTKDDIEFWMKKTPREGRKPVAMSWEVKGYLDARFEDMFGWRARNGVFAIGNHDHVVEHFDNPYIIFVPNGFKYVWSTEFGDLNLYNGDVFLHNIEIILDVDSWVSEKQPYRNNRIKEANENIEEGFATFTDKDINKALKSGNEISFKCNHYYLVNPDILTDVNTMSWIYNIGGA